MVNAGAMYSALNKALVPLRNDDMMIRGVTGQTEKVYFCKPLEYKLRKQWGIYKFLYMPNGQKPF